MTRILGDRKKGITLDEALKNTEEAVKEMEERERLEELARKEAERKAKEKPKEAPSEQVITQPSGIIPANYNDIEFEPFAAKIGNAGKYYMLYNESLARLRRAGYERHASPSEAFAFMCGGLEGNLDSTLKAVFDNMVSGFGEWLSMAFKRKGDLLIAYLHPEPEGIFWNGKEYVSQKFAYSEKREFKVRGKNSGEAIPLQEFGDDFSQYVYSRKYADLPKEMREGSLMAHIVLPPEGGELHFVGRNYGDNGDNFKIMCNSLERASRGVRKKMPGLRLNELLEGLKDSGEIMQ